MHYGSVRYPKCGSRRSSLDVVMIGNKSCGRGVLSAYLYSVVQGILEDARVWVVIELRTPWYR